jgi:cytochrome c peroxidase
MQAKRGTWLLSITLVTGLCYLLWQWLPSPALKPWTNSELALIQSLSLNSLPAPPLDPGNHVADHIKAAELGHRLFFDTRLSANGQVSCASCHIPEHHFTDRRPRGIAIGLTERNTMPLAGVAYSPWFFWDGRKDSLWSQALAPFEDPREHGLERLGLLRLFAADAGYQELYTTLFGDFPDLSDLNRFPFRASPLGSDADQAAWHAMHPQDRHTVSQAFANIGKALAAYQRLLVPGPTPFDHYASALQNQGATSAGAWMSSAQVAGLKLFLNKAQCVNCHNGPLFTNNSFHNTAVLSALGTLPAAGRSAGIRLAESDEFNCLGLFSDASAQQCHELRFSRRGDEMIGAQRTASLRNLSRTAPYMHAGQLDSLDAVIEHYNKAAVAVIGHNEAKPLKLRAIEKRQLRAFLESLEGPLATDTQWLSAPY